MDSKTQLRQIFRNMDGNRAQEIREAYYKAIEGLMTLAKELDWPMLTFRTLQRHCWTSTCMPLPRSKP